MAIIPPVPHSQIPSSPSFLPFSQPPSTPSSPPPPPPNSLEKAAADGVVHTEIFLDPQTHTSRGIAIEVAITNVSRACHDAKSKYGLSAKIILCILRHLSEADAMEMIEAALPYRVRGRDGLK